ncbi:MAG: aminopeptidase [Nanoarchaeota archaeon]|nr:aminopeptidase [Nanoarchaeota archaeon]
MYKTAQIVWKECLAFKKNEKALIIYDKDKEEIAKTLFDVGKEISSCELLLMPKTTRAGEEPSDSVREKILSGFNVIVAPTTFSLTHTNAIQSTLKQGARIVTMPGITKDTFLRAIPLDYITLKKTNDELIEKLQGNKFHVETRLGTDITLFRGKKSKERKFHNCCGIAHESGKLLNLPDGEVAFAPLEKKSEGKIVIDATCMGLVKKPFKIYVEGGEMVDCENKDLWKLLTSVDKGTNLAELGIGTNPKAKIVGLTLEDEKVLGTAHIAFGTNKSLGGKVQNSVHIDNVFYKPTISVDGKVVIEEGKF